MEMEAELSSGRMEYEPLVKETRSPRDSLFKEIRKLAKNYVKKKEYTKAIDLCSSAIYVYTKENRYGNNVG